MSFRPVKPRAFGTTKELAARLFDACGGVKQAAFLLALSPTQVYAYADPDAEDQISLDRTRRLATASRCEAPAVDFCALAGGFFTPAERGDEALTDLIARGEQAHGRFLPRLLGLIGKHGAGALTTGERAELARELDIALGAFAAARARLGEGSDG